VIRRFQLLDAESQPSGYHLAEIGDRIRDGLLRENKVVPAALGFLALLIFAWLVASALIGGPGEEERASSQASLAQEEDSGSGSPETPAPGVENRDTDSYSAFESKDPFRNIIAEKGSNQTTGSQGGENQAGGRPSANRPSANRPSNDGSSNRSSSNTPGGGAAAGGDDESTDQSIPGGPVSGGPGAVQGGGAQPGAPQNGTGGLFNSGGDLPPP
jgi:hypothetical protein